MNRRGFFGALATLALAPVAAAMPKLYQEDINQCYLLDGGHRIQVMDVYFGKMRPLDESTYFYRPLNGYRRMPVGPVVPAK